MKLHDDGLHAVLMTIIKLCAVLEVDLGCTMATRTFHMGMECLILHALDLSNPRHSLGAIKYNMASASPHA